jgi:hypothetical protein
MGSHVEVLFRQVVGGLSAESGSGGLLGQCGQNSKKNEQRQEQPRIF